jgi:oxygen-independent coproporphyrinogen-3 oxidase
MAGIYVHIPFCKQACSYCNFHFSTKLQTKEDVLAAIQQEVSLQANYLPQRQIDTLYFGGGTPSILQAHEINAIIEAIQNTFSFADDMEITLEANPDDLTGDKIKELRSTPINRFSIGIQSFRNADLQFMNRPHTAHEAYQAINKSQRAGYTNMTIDLIYGSPTLPDDAWRENLHTVFQMGIPHISAYALTVEPGTALNHWIEKGKVSGIDEEQAGRQLELLMDEMAANGYDHYEISNFCKPGYRAQHNTNYWFNIPYLGLGAGAHSFNGTTRQWNVANNVKYAKAILHEGKVPFEQETLSLKDRYNETLLTSLRTKWGCHIGHLKANFPDHYNNTFAKESARLLEQGLLQKENDHIKLSRKGTLVADSVIADLFAE